MNEFKGTPGPWRVARSNPSPTTGEWMIAGAKPGYLAEVRDCGSGNVEANAHLIAAAPELLESAKKALQLLQERRLDGGMVGADLENAIAKALGND